MTDTRYTRQIILPEIGQAGQEKLKRARVLIIGAGGLGSPAAFYLAAAGVGTLGLCDGDTVELSNLQRQILYSTRDLGRKKVTSAHKTLADINPNMQIIVHDCFAAPEHIAQLISRYDFVLDCTDSYASKFLINDACVTAGKPFCHGGAAQFCGQTTVWLPGIGAPCCRCFFREVPPQRGKQGILGAAAGVIGCLQAAEAVKYITGAGKPLTGALLFYDALEGGFHRVALPKAAPDCPVCGATANCQLSTIN